MAETFGKTDKGSLTWGNTANRINASKYTSGSAGNLDKLSVYLLGGGSAGKAKCAIYDASYNKLANGETVELDIESQDEFMHFTFPIKPAVAAATVYWLCFWHNIEATSYADADGADSSGYRVLTYGAWPEPLGLTNFYAYNLSIYATYEEAPPPAAKTLVQATLISLAPLVVLPALAEILKFARS